jgi:polysaccharide deacetylase 2 family uncharacterized protein YibQ
MSFFRGLSGFIVGVGLGSAGLIVAMAFISPVNMENSPEKAVQGQIKETTEQKQSDMVEVMPIVPEITEKPEKVKEKAVAIVTPDPVETTPAPKIVKVKPPVLPKSEEVSKEPVAMDKPAKVELPKIDAKEPEKPTEITIGKKPSSTLPTIEPKEPKPAPVVKAPVEEVKPQVVIAGNALKSNAVTYEIGDRPLLAVILQDIGDKGLSVKQLKSLRAPITIAIGPDNPNAIARAAAYKDAGFEVIAMVPIDRNSPLNSATNPGQIDAALETVFSNVPNAIGLMDNRLAMVQKNSRTADAIVKSFKQSGYGLITYAKGLNAVDRMAATSGVRTAKIARMLDANHENKALIIRYLDRVSLDAGRDGAAIVLGTTDKATVIALAGWLLSSKGQNVALAPASAVLLGK